MFKKKYPPLLGGYWSKDTIFRVVLGGDAGDETGSSSVKNDQSFTSLESFSLTYKIDSCFDSKTL